jgi:hypothetical protein
VSETAHQSPTPRFLALEDGRVENNFGHEWRLCRRLTAFSGNGAYAGVLQTHAQAKAKTLVDWFEFGVRGEDDLARVIRDDIQLADVPR